MAEFVDVGTKTFIANGAITQHQRVKIEAAGTVAVAGLAEKEIGTARDTVATGKPCTVILTSKEGTCKMIASEAIAVAAPVYTESDGEVQDTAQATSYLVGIALSAAAADQDVIEVLRNSHGDTAAT
jgi:hypothetical protein